MLSVKFFLTIIVITFAISLIQWFFIGFLFHKYQSLTPATWRNETSISYILSILTSLIFAFLFTTIFYVWKAKFGEFQLIDAIKFGSICWLTFSVTIEIGTAIYVNFSRMFIVGKCLSSLVEYIVAGVIAYLLL